MFGLIFGQTSLWFILILGLTAIMGTFLYRKKRDTAPAIIASVVFVVLTFAIYGLGIRYGTDVDDFCILNGHVVSATYEEPWTEQYTETETYRDSKGNTKTRTVTKTRRNGPEWHAKTTVGGTGLSAARYAGMARRFGNERQTGSSHSGQISHGDGRTFEVRWNGKVETIIPWCTSEEVINWVKASKGTVEKRAGAASTPAPGYPDIIETARGPKQPRVLLVGVNPPAGWKDTMEWEMDVLADKAGSERQANPLLVITNQGPAFLESLREAWINGKKNDVVLVMGTKTWPQIEWADVLCWSSDTSLTPFLKAELAETDLADRQKVMQALTAGIMRHYTRKPMADFEYLKNGIDVPAWIPWTCVLLATAACAVVALIQDEPKPIGFTYHTHCAAWPGRR